MPRAKTVQGMWCESDKYWLEERKGRGWEKGKGDGGGEAGEGGRREESKLASPMKSLLAPVSQNSYHLLTTPKCF